MRIPDYKHDQDEINRQVLINTQIEREGVLLALEKIKNSIKEMPIEEFTMWMNRDAYYYSVLPFPPQLILTKGPQEVSSKIKRLEVRII